MEHVGGLVSGWMRDANLGLRQTALLAGVSASTLHRILHGQTSPTVDTLLEVAAACNVYLSLAGEPMSDPEAAAAARTLLEEDYDDERPGVSRWAARLQRRAGIDDPTSLLHAAAIAANPLQRSTAHLFAGDVEPVQLASAGQSTSGRWALSGAAGLRLARPDEVDVSTGVTILWTTDCDLASAMLGSAAPKARPTQSLSRATCAVIEAESELFINSFMHGQLIYCAPIQILLDCLGQSGPVAEIAMKEARSW